MGRALWMVSVSVNGSPRDRWTADMERLAMRVIDRVLDGVGVRGDDRVQHGAVTILVRRQCAERERLQVPEPYFAGGAT